MRSSLSGSCTWRAKASPGGRARGKKVLTGIAVRLGAWRCLIASLTPYRTPRQIPAAMPAS